MTTTDVPHAHDADDGSDRRLLLGVVTSVLVLGLLLAGAGELALTRLGVLGEPGVTVIGTVDLVDLGTNANGCTGIGAYADVAVGTAVTLTDPTGSVLGTARLGDPIGFGDSGCVFTFRVAHVTTSAAQYAVHVGRSDPVVSSRAAMSANGWTTEVHLER